MKKMNLSNDYLSAFCLQISLLLHAGISIGDGLHMLSEDEEDPAAKKILQSMSEQVDNGLQISEVMEQSECFPDYVVYMTRTGEETGRTEEAFKALSDYYEEQRQLSERIRSALLYPVILLILMLLILIWEIFTLVYYLLVSIPCAWQVLCLAVLVGFLLTKNCLSVT